MSISDEYEHEPEGFVRAQPVPSAAARIVPTGGIGIAKDRLRVWSRYGQRFRGAMTVVEQAWAERELTERQRSRGRMRNDRVGTLADLAAVQLYLTGEWAWLDEALPEGEAGAHLPLSRCVASGLRRLPSYRGPAVVRGGAVGAVTDWYRDHRFVTESGFWTASSSPAALREGGPGFLVWSLTARRTAVVAPYGPDRLVFLPGTRFKVLRVTELPRPVVLMRELFPEEADSPDEGGISWLDRSTVEELDRVVSALRAAAGPSVPPPVGIAGPRGRLPGLIAPAETAARAGR
ncbi:hypothetical protein [Streptomyces sp. NPDC000878]